MIQELDSPPRVDGRTKRRRQDALHDANGQPYLRTLVLRGEGKHFCAGADINMMRDAGANTPEENRADSERLDRLFNGLWAHPCFTVGAVQGRGAGRWRWFGGVLRLRGGDPEHSHRTVRRKTRHFPRRHRPLRVPQVGFGHVPTSGHASQSRPKGRKRSELDSSKRWWTNRTTWRRRSPPSFPRS